MRIKLASLALLFMSVPSIALQKIHRTSSSQDAQMVEITHAGECITLFVGLGSWSAGFRSDKAPRPTGTDLSEATLILSPTCKNGRVFPVSQIWPEFAKHLRFRFFARSDSTDVKERELEGTLSEGNRPVWGEHDAVRTLVFRLEDVPPFTSSVRIEVDSGGERISNLRFVIEQPK